MEKDLYYETFRAEDSHWWFLALHELIEYSVKKYTNHTAPSDHSLKILDAGCGTGKLMSRLSQFGSVTGIDFSEHAIELCRKGNLQDVFQQDLSSWRSPGPLYDVITSIDVLYHKAIPDDIAVLKEFFKALKPGGIMILNLAAFDCLKRKHDVSGFGVRRYRRSVLVKELKKIGFQILIQSYRLSYLFLPLILKAWIERSVSQEKVGSDLNSIPPKPINNVLLTMNKLENEIIKRINLPFGVSLFVLAQKPTA